MSTQQSAASNSGKVNGTVCHILPCSIDEDLTAPIAQYFHPTELPADALPKKNGSPDDDNANTKDYAIMAAQFRGRGLLCAVDSPLSGTNDDAHGEGAPSDDATCVDDTTSSSKQQSKPITLSKLPPNMIGVALSQSSSHHGGKSTAATNPSKDPPTQPLKVIETFQHVYNWNHEHDVQRVTRERYGSDKHGLNAVLGWCDLAHEVSYI